MQVHREDRDHLVVIEQILGGGCVPADMVPLTKDLQFKDVISAPTAAGHRRRQREHRHQDFSCICTSQNQQINILLQSDMAHYRRL